MTVKKRRPVNISVSHALGGLTSTIMHAANPTASWGSSISYHLRATTKILRDVASNTKNATTLGEAEVNALERDAFEVLRLIRFWRNMVAPINKIPPEILALVPDFFGPEDKDEDVIALTHVCQFWREVFVSRPSLWVDLDCKNREKTQVYLERSRSSPISISLREIEHFYPCDPFFQVISHAMGRLKSLSIEATPEYVQAITSYLSYPPPLLEHLKIYSDYYRTYDYPVLASALFSGDLSLLRTLDLDSVHTELPWRNMVNLTSFRLAYNWPEEVSVGRLLDFFEGAPHLREVTLFFVIPTTGAQDGRLVSLVCLKSMSIEGDRPSSVLLDHLLIPVGAKLTTQVDLRDSLIGEHLPRSLDNLKNFSNFTTIRLYLDGQNPRTEFSGPNGEVTTTLKAGRIDRMLDSLTQLDTSKTERLEFNYGGPLFGDSFCQALILMKNLRTLTLSTHKHPHIVHALNPGASSSEVACPKLEELVIVPYSDEEALDIRGIIEIVAGRASRGKKLRTIRIVGGGDKSNPDVLELRKHVWNVECGP